MTAATLEELPPALLILLSGERDHWLRRVLDAEILGYDRGREAGYAEGRRDEAADMAEAWAAVAKPAARSLAASVGLEGRRWRLRGEDRTRETFGQPHPGDRPAGQRTAVSSHVWLGGPPVHHHQCSPACRSYRTDRPYTPAEAASILARLPGDYAREIARLRALARERAAS